MQNLTLLHDLDAVGIWFVSASILAFLLVYTKGCTSWAWSRNQVGRTIVGLDLCLLLLTVPSCIQKIVGRIAFFYSVGWQYVLVIDVFMVGIIAAYRTLTWAKMYWWDPRPGAGPGPDFDDVHTWEDSEDEDSN